MNQSEPELIGGVEKRPETGMWQTWYALGRFAQNDFLVLPYSAYATKQAAEQEIKDLYAAVKRKQLTSPLDIAPYLTNLERKPGRQKAIPFPPEKARALRQQVAARFEN